MKNQLYLFFLTAETYISERVEIESSNTLTALDSDIIRNFEGCNLLVPKEEEVGELLLYSH